MNGGDHDRRGGLTPGFASCFCGLGFRGLGFRVCINQREKQRHVKSALPSVRKFKPQLPLIRPNSYKALNSPILHECRVFAYTINPALT